MVEAGPVRHSSPYLGSGAGDSRTQGRWWCSVCRRMGIAVGIAELVSGTVALVNFPLAAGPQSSHQLV